MASDNGKQIITFRYQQEGTAVSFNKLFHGVIPRGIISGGLLVKEDNSTVAISPLQMVIGDNNVTIHVQTQEDAHVGVNSSKPFIIATFNWAELTDNYVKFESSSFNDLPKKSVSQMPFLSVSNSDIRYLTISSPCCSVPTMGLTSV